MAQPSLIYHCRAWAWLYGPYNDMTPSDQTSPWTPLLMSWTILGWSRSRPGPSQVWAGGFSSRARHGFNGLAGHGLSDRKLETQPGQNNYCLKKLGDLFFENDRKHGLDGLTKVVRLKDDMIEMGWDRAQRLWPMLGWIWACCFKIETSLGFKTWARLEYASVQPSWGHEYP